MHQHASERTPAPISSNASSSVASPPIAESLSRSSARRRDRSRRRVRALLCAGGVFTAAAGLALTALVEPADLAAAGLITAGGTQGVTAPRDAPVDFSREPAAPSSASSMPAGESKVSTLSDGKPIVADPAPTKEPVEEESKKPVKPTKEPAKPKEPVEKPVEDPTLGAPLSELSVASPYGNRVNPMGGYGQELHTGTDFAGACGTPVLASDGGTVTESGWHPYGGGQRIVIDHGEGLKTTYNHLSSLGTPVGGKVDRGATIGAVGTTGNSTGCHLHFEVLVNGKTVDPSGHL